MSLTNCSSGNYYRCNNTLSAALTSDLPLGLNVWYYPAAAGSGAVRGIARLGVAETGSSTNIGVYINASNQLSMQGRTGANSLSISVVATITHDAWMNIFAIMDGPADGSSRAIELYINGVLAQNNAFTTATISNDVVDTISVGLRGADVPNAGDRFAYVGAGNFANLAAAQAAAASAPSTDPASISGMDFAWSFNNTANASLGGVNMAAVGSPTLDTTMPTLSGGSSNLHIITSFI